MLDRDDGTILKMVKYFYVSRKGYVSKSLLFRKLKDYSKDVGGADRFVEELDQFARFYSVARKEQSDVLIKDYFESIEMSAISTDADKYQSVHLALQALRLFRVSQIYPLIFAAISAIKRTGGGSLKSNAKTHISLSHSIEQSHFSNNSQIFPLCNE